MNEITNKNPEASIGSLGGAITGLALIAGLLALAMLPVGVLQSVRNQSWDYLFFSHIGTLASAAVISLLGFVRLARRSRWNTYLGLALVLIFLIPIIAAGAVPIVSRDALIHHLVVPQWWLERGRIAPIQWHEWSYYPMLLNLGFAGLLAHGLEFLTPYYHGAYLIILCGVISCFCFHKTRDYELSLVAFLFTLTLPICMKLASTPLVDLGLALYAGIAFVSIVYWSGGRKMFLYVCIAGVALGLGMGCKYNGMLAAMLLCGLMLVLGARSKLSLIDILLGAIICGTVAFFVCLPWLAKNIYWTTTNPFYPLFQGLFGAGPPTAAGMPAGISPLMKLQALYHQSELDIILMPFRMILFGEDNNPVLYDGRLSPVLLLLIVPLFYVKRYPWVTYAFLFLLSYFYISIGYSSARVRYMAPLLVPAVALAIIGLQCLAGYFKDKHRTTVYSAFIFLHLLFAVHYSYVLLRDTQTVPFLTKRLSRQQYLTNYIPEYPMIKFINSYPTGDLYTYLLNTGNKFYYYDRPVISGGYYSARTLLTWLKNSADPQTLAKDMLDRRVGYLLVHTQRTAKLLESILKGEERAFWNTFQNEYLDLIHYDAHFSFWRVRTTSALEEESAIDAALSADNPPINERSPAAEEPVIQNITHPVVPSPPGDNTDTVEGFSDSVDSVAL